jgi:hypothetical protein
MNEDLGLARWIASKGLWYVLAIAGAYSIAWFFDIVPTPVKNLLSWFDSHSAMLLFTLCFCLTCFTIIKVTGRKKKGETVE